MTRTPAGNSGLAKVADYSGDADPPFRLMLTHPL